MDIPRELIYEEKKDIKAFGIDDKSSLNSLIYDNWLLNQTDLKPFEPGLSNRRLKVFNDAYYICTLIMMHPTSEDFASYAKKRCTIPSIVFPMVYFYISKVSVRDYSNSRLLEDIKTGLKSEGWDDNLAELLKVTSNYSGSISPLEFSQRQLTPELLLEMKWYEVTGQYNKEDILKIVRYIAKNENEWVMMLDSIRNAVCDYEWEYNQHLDFVDDEGQWWQESPKDMTPICQFIDELKERYDEESIHEDRFQTPTENEDTISLVHNSNDNEVVGQTAVEWDNRYDGFLEKNLNAQAIYNVLVNIYSPHLIKTQRPFWYVLYIVLVEIRWAVNKKGNQKLILQWANHHFKCGWDWKKNNLFKFSDINKKIKTTPTSQWNEDTMLTSAGLYYSELANQMKSAFVEEVNGGKLIDRAAFINNGYQRINNGH